MSESPKVPGITSGWYPGAISAFGFTIDSWMKSASFPDEHLIEIRPNLSLRSRVREPCDTSRIAG